MTSERALVGHLQTFVDVFAHLVGKKQTSPKPVGRCTRPNDESDNARYLSRSRREPVRADALEPALQIRARPVPAHVRVDLALVLVHALPSRLVQNVSGRTLAPVRPVRVDALAAVARVGHEIALVQVFAPVTAADALGTQSGERVCDRTRANRTGEKKKNVF